MHIVAYQGKKGEHSALCVVLVAGTKQTGRKETGSQKDLRMSRN